SNGKKDTQEETECVEILCSTKQTEHIILDTHIDNKNDNIKENSYQRKEVAINITHMATKNQEITHNPLQMDQMSLDIDTGNTKVHISVTKEKLTTYTLWDLPRLFNNGQVKRLIGRYGKEEDLEIRKQYKLTLYGLPGNTAEVLLLRQVRHLKAKAVYILVNANFNPRRSAFVYFSSNEDLLKAYKSKAESKNNSTQQEGAETSSRYKSEIKEKKTTRFSKKNGNRTEKKTLELGNYTIMKPKWKHTSKENNNATENLNTRRMIYKNNLSNENKERSDHPKNKSLNTILQEILNRLEKIESSYSSSRAIATPDTRRAPTAPKVAKGISKKKGLGGANLKGKEKEHLTDDIEYMMKNRFMRINKAEGSKKMKTLENYQILKEWAAYIIQASTKDMDLVTNSDHKLLITALDTGINTRFRSYAETRKKGKRRLVFELEKATENDWVHYKGKLERRLLSKIHIDKEISMDEEWDIIQSSIIKATQTFLPMKKKLAEMLKTEDTRKTDVLQLLRKRIRKLGTFCHRMRKRVLMPQEEKELYKLCKDIEKNYEIDTSYEQTQDTEEKRYKNHKRATDKKDSTRTYEGGEKPLCSENSNTTHKGDDKENSIQEGPKLKRCQGCNDEQKEQSRGCLLQRNFKSNKKAIDKKLISKSNEKEERELLVPIKLFNFKPFINEVTTEQLKKKPAISYLAIEPLEERILKECIKGKEVIDEL
ncbi:27514_t:CDS:2, partial [Gigaspora margarita]